ncbi:hypothetical protein N9B90_00040 [bacterium]|nr:hypothetical protein [bacterium]
MIRPPLACALLLCTSLASQNITLAEGTPSSLTIVTLPESNPNAAATVVLQDIEFLPIEITGRTLGQELDVTKSRLVTSNGLHRVELPSGGRLFRYKRQASAYWGFLHVTGDGSAHVVLELPSLISTDPLEVDPFEDRIGISRNGDIFAVPSMTGGLYMVRLDGTNYASTGAPHRLVAPTTFVENSSLMVGDTAAWFQSDILEVFFCDFADNAIPVDVSPPQIFEAELDDEMAMAGDGSSVAFLYGKEDQEGIWIADLSGGITMLPIPQSDYEDPDYLPEGLGSSQLMLNESGSRLFFVDSDIREELFLLDTSGQLPPLQITEDQIFEPYIGVHILPGFLADELTIAIGDPNLMDWYRANLSPSGGTVENLTDTGSATQPYTQGLLDPQLSIRQQGITFAVEQSSNALNIRRIDPATGSATLLHTNATKPPTRGSSTTTRADMVVHTQQGDRLYSSSTSLPLYALPSWLAIDGSARGPVFSVMQVTFTGTNWSVPVFFLPNGHFVLTDIYENITQLIMTNANGTIIIHGNDATYLTPGFSTTINRPPTAWRRCISGAGV